MVLEKFSMQFTLNFSKGGKEISLSCQVNAPKDQNLKMSVVHHYFSNKLTLNECVLKHVFFLQVRFMLKL